MLYISHPGRTATGQTDLKAAVLFLNHLVFREAHVSEQHLTGRDMRDLKEGGNVGGRVRSHLPPPSTYATLLQHWCFCGSCLER